MVLARSLNPIPSRTRPLNSSAPMVLWLKPWESRSLPGLPRTKIPLQRFHDQAKRRFPSGRRRFLLGHLVRGPRAMGSSDKRQPCPREMRGASWRYSTTKVPPNRSRRFSRISSISVVTSMKVESNATTSIRESFDRSREGPSAEMCSLGLSELIEAGIRKKTRSRLVDDCGSSRPRDLSRQ